MSAVISNGGIGSAAKNKDKRRIDNIMSKETLVRRLCLSISRSSYLNFQRFFTFYYKAKNSNQDENNRPFKLSFKESGREQCLLKMWLFFQVSLFHSDNRGHACLFWVDLVLVFFNQLVRSYNVKVIFYMNNMTLRIYDVIVSSHYCLYSP